MVSSLLHLPNSMAMGSHNIALDCEGKLLVVGDPLDQVRDNAGAVYVLDVPTGKLLHTLRSPCPQRGDEFGTSIAINCQGTKVIVGAKKNHQSLPGVTAPGVVYVFDISPAATTSSSRSRNNDNNYQLRQTIQNPYPQEFDEFGSVAFISESGNVFAVSAPNHNQNEGIVYLFQENGNNGTLHTLLRTFRPPPKMPALQPRKSTRTFHNNSNSSNNSNKVEYEELHRDQFFGSSIALSDDGSRLVVGAPGKGWTKQLPGSVYLFDAEKGKILQRIQNPVEQHAYDDSQDPKINNDDGRSQNDYFASTVAMSGDGKIIVVGAMLAKKRTHHRRQTQTHKRAPSMPSQIATSGLVYIFDPQGNIIRTISSPSQSNNSSTNSMVDHFGISVSTNRRGDRILVGAPHPNDGASNHTSPFPIAFLMDISGNILQPIYNPSRAATKVAAVAPTQGATLQFGGSTVLARSGHNAAISSTFHPLVEAVCFPHGEDSCLSFTNVSLVDLKKSMPSMPDQQDRLSMSSPKIIHTRQDSHGNICLDYSAQQHIHADDFNNHKPVMMMAFLMSLLVVAVAITVLQRRQRRRQQQRFQEAFLLTMNLAPAIDTFSQEPHEFI